MTLELVSKEVVLSAFNSAKTPAEMDDAVMSLVRMGAVPDYIAVSDWPVVEISGGGHTLRIRVAPTNLTLGDPPTQVARTRPFGAQDVADYFDSILPSRKLLRDIQHAASPRISFLDVKSPPYSIPLAKIETEEALEAASDMADSAFEDHGIAPGEGLVIGYKKAIVTGPNLDGSRVAIFGGIGTNLDPTTGQHDIVQSYYTGHPSSYSDYSHGIVLVSRKAVLDGSPVDLRDDVFGSTDPKIIALVSDQGRFDPVFPNAGKSSRAKFVATPSPSSAGGGSSSSSSSSPKLVSPAASSTSSQSSIGRTVLAGGAILGGLATAIYLFFF